MRETVMADADRPFAGTLRYTAAVAAGRAPTGEVNPTKSAG